MVRHEAMVLPEQRRLPEAPADLYCTCSQSKKCELLFMLLDLGVVITAMRCSLFMLIQSLQFWNLLLYTRNIFKKFLKYWSISGKFSTPVSPDMNSLYPRHCMPPWCVGAWSPVWEAEGQGAGTIAFIDKSNKSWLWDVVEEKTKNASNKKYL